MPWGADHRGGRATILVGPSLARQLGDAAVARAMSDEVLLPAQRATGVADSPSRMLWRSVLVLAIADVVGGTWVRGRPTDPRSRDALRWLLSDSQAVGSCRWICEVLGIPVAVVRRGAARRLGTRTPLRRSEHWARHA